MESETTQNEKKLKFVIKKEKLSWLLDYGLAKFRHQVDGFSANFWFEITIYILVQDPLHSYQSYISISRSKKMNLCWRVHPCLVGTYLVKKFTSHIKRWVQWLALLFSLLSLAILCPKPWVPWQFQTLTRKTKKALLLSPMGTPLVLERNPLHLCRKHQPKMVSYRN